MNFKLTAYRKSARKRILCFLEYDDLSECKYRRPHHIFQKLGEDPQASFDTLDCPPKVKYLSFSIPRPLIFEKKHFLKKKKMCDSLLKIPCHQSEAADE